MSQVSRVSLDEESREMLVSALEHIKGVCDRMHGRALCLRSKCIKRRRLIGRLTDNRPGKPYYD